MKKSMFLLAIIAGATWGTHGTFATLMGQYGMSDDTISLISPLAYGGFFLFMLLKDDIRKIKFAPKWTPVILCYAFTSSFYVYSVIKAYWYMPVGIVHTVVFSSLFPLMILSRICFKDPFTRQKIISSVFAVLGIAMLLNVFDASGLNLKGVAWTISAMLFWSGMVTFEKFLLEKGFDSNAVLVYSGGFGFLFLTLLISPISAANEIITATINSHGAVFLPLLGFIFITNVGSYYCYIKSLQHLEQTYVQLGFIADPLMATILGLIFFQQTLLPIQIAGVALILAIVIWIEISEIRKEKEHRLKMESPKHQ